MKKTTRYEWETDDYGKLDLVSNNLLDIEEDGAFLLNVDIREQYKSMLSLVLGNVQTMDLLCKIFDEAKNQLKKIEEEG
jgi:hypothetical protein